MTQRTTKTITVSVSPRELQKIQKLAKDGHKSKSQVVRDMLAVYEEYVAEKEWEEIRRHGEKTAKRLGITTEEDVVRLIHEARGIKY